MAPTRKGSVPCWLIPRTPSITDEQAVELVKTAHQVCPYSNATRDNIDVALVVNSTRL